MDTFHMHQTTIVNCYIDPLLHICNVHILDWQYIHASYISYVCFLSKIYCTKLPQFTLFQVLI
jgi:hypothetical protein